MLKAIFLALLLLSSYSIAAPSIRMPLELRPAFSLVIREKPTLNLYYSNHCPYSKKVLNYLYAIHKKVPMTDVQNNPEAKEYLKTHGGLMQVPCLFIDGQPLYESDDIIQWLSEHQDLLENA